MEWMVPVNDMLSENITKLNYTLIPPGFHGDVRSVRVIQESLSKLIDFLGDQSASAQGLHKVITTAEKLRNSPTHILYLLKDAKAKNGNGDVIGFLKVGQKHLFLFDGRDKVCEVEPLCVLDFYVLKDRQRHGYGKVLFDHMLQDMRTTTHELAVDGPSPKMEQFLCKNYGVENLIRQNNNFAVSPKFFTVVPEIGKSGRTTPVETPTGAVGRFSAPKPQSVIANVIHGGHSAFQETSNENASGAATPDNETNGAHQTEHQKIGDHFDIAKKEYNEGKADDIAVKEPKPAIEEAALQKNHERPSTLEVEPVTEIQVTALSPAGSVTSRRDSQLTDRGYFDVKFYHNKLW